MAAVAKKPNPPIDSIVCLFVFGGRGVGGSFLVIFQLLLFKIPQFSRLGDTCRQGEFLDWVVCFSGILQDRNDIDLILDQGEAY